MLKLLENPLPKIDIKKILVESGRTENEANTLLSWFRSERESLSGKSNKEGIPIFEKMVRIYALEPLFFILSMKKQETGWLTDSENITLSQSTSALADLLEKVLEAFSDASHSWLSSHEDFIVENLEESFNMVEDEKDRMRIAAEHMVDAKMGMEPDHEAEAIIVYDMLERFLGKNDAENVFKNINRKIREETEPPYPPDTSYTKNDTYPALALWIAEGEWPSTAWQDDKTYAEIAVEVLYDIICMYGGKMETYVRCVGETFDVGYSDYLDEYEDTSWYNTYDAAEISEKFWDGSLAIESGNEIYGDNIKVYLEINEMFKGEEIPDEDWVKQALIMFHFAKTINHNNGSIFEYMGLTGDHFDALSELGMAAMKPAAELAKKFGVKTSYMKELERMME